MNQDHRHRRLELSTTQIAGSALAAMSGAFFASWAGTAGTIIGAAAASVIATVGAATYTWSLQRTGDAVKRTAAQVRQAALVANPEPAPREPRRLDLPWGKVALASLAVMVAGLGGITAIETLTGQPVSSYTGASDAKGTTLGGALGSGSGAKTSQDSSSTSGTGKSERSTGEAPDASDSTPTPDPGQTAPSTPATPAPSDAPSAEASQAPTEDDTPAPDAQSSALP